MYLDINFENLITFDCEVYRNYFLVSFKHLPTGRVLSIEIKGEETFINHKDRAKILELIEDYSTFGFNSVYYDIPMLYAATQCFTCFDLYEFSKDLITDSKSKETRDKRRLILRQKPGDIPHFDIKGVFGRSGSLKSLGALLHAPTIKNLPFDPNKSLTKEDMVVLKKYCENDLNLNIVLYEAAKKDVFLRDKMSKLYNMNLMNVSDAGVAESVIANKVSDEIGRNVSRVFVDEGYLTKQKIRYKKPSYLQFEEECFKKMEDLAVNTEYSLNVNTGRLNPIGITTRYMGLDYKFGVGGLHSCEQKVCHICKEDEVIIHADVTSFYPNLILNQELYPEKMTSAFLKIYKKITQMRIKAKKEGDKTTADMLKIVINSSYGKFSYQYSTLYSPRSLLYVVLTGQLSLCMLIEMLGKKEVRTLSANTDGIYVLLKKDKMDVFKNTCKEWEEKTNLNLEHTEYNSLYSASVNSYIAFKEKGYKSTGIYSYASIGRSLHGDIMVDCIVNFIRYKKPVKETLKECKDIRKFLLSSSVKIEKSGTIMWKGTDYGGLVRYYYSTEGEEMRNSLKDDKIPNTDFSKPVVDLPDELPKDIFYEKYWYVVADRLRSLGCHDDSMSYPLLKYAE